MTRNTAADKPQARRAQILDQALHMFGDHGFNGLTVQALAARCGISNAGLLYYFGSKDDLLMAVLAEFEARESEVIAPLVEAVRTTAGRPDKAAALLSLLEQMVATFATQPHLASFLFVLQTEALDRTNIAHDWFYQRDTMTLKLFEEVTTGISPNPGATAHQIVALMQGLGQHWLRQKMSFDLTGEWRKALRSILPGCFLDDAETVAARAV